MAHIQPKIIQLIPCENWWSVYTDDKGIDTYYPLPCMALDEEGTISFMDPDCDGIFNDPTEAGNFKQIIFSKKDPRDE